MKREIKFRAWDWKEMYSPSIDWWDFSISQVLNDTDNLMQYTWLRDKNWKEIYEWDIVKVWDYEWLEIVFQDGRFIPLLWEDDEYEDDWTRETLEVIWNIYENKELLTN